MPRTLESLADRPELLGRFVNASGHAGFVGGAPDARIVRLLDADLTVNPQYDIEFLNMWPTTGCV